jgi:hypothetical protein
MKVSTSKGIEFFETVQFNTVKELAEISCNLNISTSVFKDGKRNISNFIQADMIGLDIDNKETEDTSLMSLAEAKDAFKEYKHLILASRSHLCEKNGEIAERFRVILFLEEPITNSDDFYSTWFYLKKLYPAIDPQCKDPSRFWWKHKEVLGFGNGKLLKPVKHVPIQIDNKLEISSGIKGELSKLTLKYLEFGIPTGSRNGSVYKIARDFNQNLYTQEEAESRIISALIRTKTISSDFNESEAVAAISSAYSKDAKHEPRVDDLEPRAFKYVTLSELFKTPDMPEDWLIEGLLLKGGVSVIVGIPKIGKSTIVRQLERCVLRGEKFLDRETQRGGVIHFSFDEKAKTAKRHYRTLGLDENDNLILHFGSSENSDHIKYLEEDIFTYKPSLIVIDTLFDMIDVQDVNSYAPIKKSMTQFNSLAEKTGCHILFIHHQNKPNQNYSRGSGHSVLGSTAIFGSVDCCMIFEQVDKKANIRSMSVKGRAVEDFAKVQLIFNKSSQIYTIDTDLDF